MTMFTNPHPQFQSFYSSFHHQNLHFPHHPSTIQIDFQPHDISTNESNPFRSCLLRHEKLCQSFGRSLSTQEILQIEFHFSDSVVNNYWYCEQDSTVSNYFQEFVDWKKWIAIYFDEEDSEEVVVGIFIRGLTERNRMSSSLSNSLNQAYWDAISVELSLKLSSQISTAMKTLFGKFPQRSMVVVQESKDDDEVPNLVEPTVQHEEKHPSQGDLVVDRREADTSPQIGELVTKKNPGIQDPEKLKRDEDIKVRDCKFDIKVISDFTKDASLLQKYMLDFGSPMVLVIDYVIMDLENYDEVFSLQDFSYVDEVHCINVGLQDCMVYDPGGQRHGGATHLISSIDNQMWCNGRNCCMIWSALDSLLQSGMVISYFDDKISSIGQRKYIILTKFASATLGTDNLLQALQKDVMVYDPGGISLRKEFDFASGHFRFRNDLISTFFGPVVSHGFNKRDSIGYSFKTWLNAKMYWNDKAALYVLPYSVCFLSQCVSIQIGSHRSCLMHLTNPNLMDNISLIWVLFAWPCEDVFEHVGLRHLLQYAVVVNITKGVLGVLRDQEVYIVNHTGNNGLPIFHHINWCTIAELDGAIAMNVLCVHLVEVFWSSFACKSLISSQEDDTWFYIVDFPYLFFFHLHLEGKVFAKGGRKLLNLLLSEEGNEELGMEIPQTESNCLVESSWLQNYNAISKMIIPVLKQWFTQTLVVFVFQHSSVLCQGSVFVLFGVQNMSSHEAQVHSKGVVQIIEVIACIRCSYHKRRKKHSSTLRTRWFSEGVVM